MKRSDIYISDDWLTCPLSSIAQVQAAIEATDKQPIWQEVVGGIDTIAVQFNSAQIDPSDAADIFWQDLQNIGETAVRASTVLSIPICYDVRFAPDINGVADRLGLSITDFPAWHSQLVFTVSMLGFLPGFAYLQCDTDIVDIGRLPQPRQHVAAGSLGLIGQQNCLYSFASPGGWPIIGRTPRRLFHPAKNPPTLLKAHQRVRFDPVSMLEFEAILEDQRE
ncbi:MAG: carboxyltransferase domain-containing protein [Parasphingorhabdus sp.]|uniref:5-oxoprolinase subunit B family protein n=1 Tax=Parasphingorhabdus sp. TaxID=2709688 RepID=UPI00329A797E